MFNIRSASSWTEEERVHLYGDVNHSSYRSQMSRECELLRRHAYGLSLSKSDAREARSILRGYREMFS